MKTTWSIKRIGDVCEIRTGANQKAVESSDGKYPIYGSGGPMGFAKEYRCPAQTVLIGRKGTLNNPILVQTPCWNIDTAYGLISKEMLLPAYLFYFCRNTDFTTLDPDSGRPSTKSTSIAKIQIPLPPLSEQERIVGILDAAFEKIDKLQRNAERNLENAKELFQQFLDEELTPKPGWKKSLLKDVSQGITDGDHLPPPKEAKGIPFITISNITDQQKIDFSSTFFVSQKYYNSLAVIRKAQYGDILYTVTGSYGIPVLIDFNKQFCFQRHIAIIRPNIELIDPLFLSFLLESNEIKKQADSTATGVAQKTVSLTALRKFVLFFPSLNDQKTIAKKLMCLKNKTFEIKDKYTNIKSNCAELKQQVLSSAFNGEL